MVLGAIRGIVNGRWAGLAFIVLASCGYSENELQAALAEEPKLRSEIRREREEKARIDEELAKVKARLEKLKEPAQASEPE